VEEMTTWQARPLDPIYPVLLIDELRALAHEGPAEGRGRARWVIRTKPALNAFAITFEGRLCPTTTN